ncbi:MAG: hypothetical protein BWY60_00471 [Actinobacteria bacterium ADurb.Bin346]|nr:MAG: hypothetical protein BWY60_00471 [Actinobacteria bacterium ADurb.Bin346]
MLSEGKSDAIAAIQGKNIVAVPVEYVMNNKKGIDRELFKLAHILS